MKHIGSRLGFLAIAAALFIAPSAASADTLECMTDSMVGTGGVGVTAQSSWVANVTALYGASWANITLSKPTNPWGNGDYLIIVPWYSAIPCRMVSSTAPPLVCKTQNVTGTGPLILTAKSSWVANVTSQFGVAWANVELAKHITWSMTGSGANNTATMSALPCRTVDVKPASGMQRR